MNIDVQLTNLLNEVKHELKQENRYKDELTGSVSYTLDTKGEAYNKRALLLLGFFLYARYLSKIRFSSYSTYEDVKMDIIQSEHPSKQAIISLFSEIEEYCKDEISTPYAILEAIDKNLDASQVSREKDKLVSWCLDNLFFDAASIMEQYFHEDAYGAYYNIMSSVAFSAFELPNYFEKEDASILVTIDNAKDIAAIFKSRGKAKITFYGCSHTELDIKTNILLNPLFSNYQFVNYPIEHNSKLKRGEKCEIKGKDQVFCFDAKEGFDLILSSCLCYNNDIKLDDLLYFLKPNGFAIALGLSSKKTDLSESFYQYKIPFVLTYYAWDEQLALICVKTTDNDGHVYVADVEFREIDGISMTASEIIRLIKNAGHNSWIQPLSKLDFKYCEKESVAYYNVRREEEELNYIWKEISDILIPYHSKECIHEDIDLDRILTEDRLLSSSKFNYEVGFDYNISMPKSGYLGENNISKEFNINLQSIDKIVIPHKYIEQMRPILGITGEKNDGIKQFESSLCCRYLTCPIWLTNRCYSVLMHVNASLERPICYKDFSFYADEYYQWFTSKNIQPVIIDDNYDVNYLAYRINTEKNNRKALLMPQSKIEQHLIYERLWNEHLMKLQEELSKTIQVAVEQRTSLEYLIEKQYSKEIIASRLVPDAERKIKEFLLDDVRGTLNAVNDKFTPLRKIVDYIFDYCIRRNILPPTSLNGCAKLLSTGKDQDFEMIDDGLKIIYKALGESLSYFTKITQDGSHQKESSESLTCDIDNYIRKTNNLGLFRAVLHIVMDILVWFGSIVQKYPVPLDPGVLWKDNRNYEACNLTVYSVQSGLKKYYYAGKYHLKEDNDHVLRDGDIVNIVTSREKLCAYWPEGVTNVVYPKNWVLCTPNP